MEVVVFDGVLEVFIFGDILDVDFLVNFKDVCFDFVINGEFVELGVFNVEFLQVMIGFDFCFGEVIGFWFVDQGSVMCVDGYLYGVVVVGFDGFDLCDVVWGSFNQGYWDGLVIFGEYVVYVSFVVYEV